MSDVFVSGSFDDLRSRDIRFLEEASRRGPLNLLLWDDAAVRSATGKDPKFPQAERKYLLESIRYVSKVQLVGQAEIEKPHGPLVRREDFAEPLLNTFPLPPACPVNPKSSRKKVIVTGCFDWFHSGHVRFFEEVNELGDLYVVVGNDANVKHLKGEGHPLFAEAERHYVCGSVRFVTMSLVTSGHGWLDAEPEIEKLRPDIYAVNEDGDKPEKRRFCDEHGIEYRVLKRTPKAGLDRRESRKLRGF